MAQSQAVSIVHSDHRVSRSHPEVLKDEVAQQLVTQYRREQVRLARHERRAAARKQAWLADKAKAQAAREAERAAAAAAATTTPTPTTSSGSYSSSSSGATYISEEQAASYMRAAGFPESVIPYFISTIIPNESGFCPTAVYPGHCGDVSLFYAGGPACSLFQLFHCPGPQVADPAVAAQYAYDKYQEQGLSAWGG